MKTSDWDEQSCNFRQELSNSMSYITCTQGDLVDSRLLMVRSQTVNLTLDPSFGHNLCFICPNGSCEPILNIYFPKYFQWYKEILKPLSFDPCSRPLNILESTVPKWELSWECEGSFPHTFLHSREHAVWLLGFLLAHNLASPFALVASPRLGLQQIFLEFYFYIVIYPQLHVT